jgi:chromosome segregation ATPase
MVEFREGIGTLHERRPKQETLRDIVPEGVNPIRHAVSEELTIFLQKFDKVVFMQEKDNAITEFKDALEHRISKTVDLIIKEKIATLQESVKSQYEGRLRESNNLLNSTQRELEDVRGRNKRLHESTAKQARVITDLQNKLNQKKQEIVAGDYVNHLEEEIAFLRGWVLAVYKK